MSGSGGILKIGVAGLGTVGCGLIELLERNRAAIEARAGRPIRISAVSARDRHRDRGVDLSAFEWCDNPLDLVGRCDAVAELVGGADGPALALARAALGTGKSLVTANKAMLAHHGAALAAMAEEHGAVLKFEAAAAGGIPIVKAIREGFAGNRIEEFSGILNGTCNYILSTMETEGRDFQDVLDDAKRLGYAEADPSFDIDGIDAAHKTAILAALSFGARVDFNAVAIEGIRHVSKADMEYARHLGYRIRSLGSAKRVDGGLECRVYPCMVPLSSPLAHVHGAYNAISIQGDAVEQAFFHGKGAGAGPTASAVLGDLIDLARGYGGPAYSIPGHALKDVEIVPPGEHRGRFYLRLRVKDEPGVIAAIAACLRDEAVSVESLIQRGVSAEGGVYLVLTTHRTAEHNISAATARISGLEAVLEPPATIHILD